MTPTTPGYRGECGSRDGAVDDWCTYFTSGGVFAARGRGHLWFAWTAQQYGDERPFPYVRITTVRESDLSVARSRDIYGRDVAHAYLALAPDARGNIGFIDAYGGGTGKNHHFPGSMIGVFDDVSPVSPTVDYLLRGNGNACSETVGGFDGNWGDYLTIRGWHGGAAPGPPPPTWNATGGSPRTRGSHRSAVPAHRSRACASPTVPTGCPRPATSSRSW